MSEEMFGNAQDVLTGLLSELPEEAASLADKINAENARIQEKSAEMIAEIRAKADAAIAEVENKAEEKRRALVQKAIEQLEPFQKNLLKAGEIGKAVATFVQIQALKSQVLSVQPDPGNLLAFESIGKTLYFRVLGATQGPVWGSDPYTLDSMLRVAAVHAGAVKAGEEGVVRVTIVDMSRVAIRGSQRNGVATMDWDSYRVGYRVSKS